MDKYSYELTLAMAERNAKRLWILCIIFLSALILSNAGWCYYESMFETVSTTTIDAEQSGSGTNTVVNEGGYSVVTEGKDYNN